MSLLRASKQINATGTPSSSTFLRGDDTWATPAGGGGGGDVAWTTPGSYLNSWVAFGSVYAAPGYRKLSSGLVVLRGLAKNGTGVNPSIYVLPAGYRPGFQQFFTTTSNGSIQAINIKTDGTVEVSSPYSSAYVAFDGINFYADA